MTRIMEHRPDVTEFGEFASPEYADDQFKYSVLNDPMLRMKYVQLTSELVDKVKAEQPDSLIFLDKSARPVYWLMRELWPMLAAEHDVKSEEVIVPPMPDIKFVNIDRGTWIKKTGGLEDDTGTGVNVNRSTVGRDIDNLRAAFIKDPSKVMHESDEASQSTFLDNQKIMLVDEVRVSGNTLEIAKQFFEQAFPSSTVVSEHWMHAPTGQAAGGARYNKEIPIWYSQDSDLGRGIGDLSPAASQQSEHVRIRRGRKFFSRPLASPDASSEQLRNDIRQLPHEIAAGHLPLRLNLSDLSPAALEKRLEFMEVANHGVTPSELTLIVKEAKIDPMSLLDRYKSAKKY